MTPGGPAPGPRTHLSGYQARDIEVVDYRMHELGGTGLHFRGPPLPADVLASGRYFTCIGAAQTLGCFCEQPYPDLIARATGLPALNLGYGGAGPEFFSRQTSLDRYINGGRFVIVQVMSGRSQSNSLFEANGLELLTRRSDGRQMGANEAYRSLLAGNPPLQSTPFARVARVVARRLARPRVRQLVAETRSAWVDSYTALFSRITVPRILLWFSKRAPDYQERHGSLNQLFGEFPQLVNRTMVEAVRSRCDGYVECVTSRGSPQPLLSRFTGLPVTVDPARDRPDLQAGPAWTHNVYYPSPEMHEDAAAALQPALRPLLS